MSAIFGGRDEMFRYVLTRETDDESPHTLLWVMVNPSTADAVADDATIRKCIGFAERWEYGRIAVVNLYARRSKDVDLLRSIDASIGSNQPADWHDIVGPDNDAHIAAQAAAATNVMVAWGARAKMPRSASKRIARVARILSDAHPWPLWSLGFTSSGDPRHPLMPAYATQRVVWPEGA